MSATIAGIASAYSSLSQLFGGAGAVMLGNITLTGAEVPASIKWGGKMRAASVMLPGGQVVLYPMGIEYPPLTWSGYFEGQGALVRSRAMYALLNAAKLVTLAWNDRSYSVLVSDYTVTDAHPNWLEYTVTCTVSCDNSLAPSASSPSLLSRITGGIEHALGITPSDLAGVTAGLAAAQQLAGVAGAVTGGSAAALALQGSLASVSGVTQGALSLADGNLAGAFAAAATVIPNGTASHGVASVASAVGITASLAALPIVAGAVGTATKLIGSV